MYKISFKGPTEPVYMDEIRGMALYQDWLKDALPLKVELEPGRAILSSTIKAIERGFASPDKSSQRDQNTDDIAKIASDYRRDRAIKAAYSAEVKAKDLAVPSLVWKANTGTALPKELEEQIIERQEAFFKEHPDHSLANPTCYQDLMPIKADLRPDIERHENAKRVDHVVRIAILDFVERVLQKDQYYAQS